MALIRPLLGLWVGLGAAKLFRVPYVRRGREVHGARRVREVTE